MIWGFLPHQITENGFWGRHLREILGTSKGLQKRNRMGSGKTYLLRKGHCSDYYCTRNSHCDSNGDSNRGSNHKSRDLKVRFELPKTAIWRKFLRFGLRDFKSLAICDLWLGALRRRNLCDAESLAKRYCESQKLATQEAIDHQFKSSLSLPWPSNPCLFFSFLFFCFPVFLFFWGGVFHFFSKDFRGSAKRKTLVFLGGSLFFLPPPKKRVGGLGFVSLEKRTSAKKRSPRKMGTRWEGLKGEIYRGTMLHACTAPRGWPMNVQACLKG